MEIEAKVLVGIPHGRHALTRAGFQCLSEEYPASRLFAINAIDQICSFLEGSHAHNAALQVEPVAIYHL